MCLWWTPHHGRMFKTVCICPHHPYLRLKPWDQALPSFSWPQFETIAEVGQFDAHWVCNRKLNSHTHFQLCLHFLGQRRKGGGVRRKSLPGSGLSFYCNLCKCRALLISYVRSICDCSNVYFNITKYTLSTLYLFVSHKESATKCYYKCTSQKYNSYFIMCVY